MNRALVVVAAFSLSTCSFPNQPNDAVCSQTREVSLEDFGKVLKRDLLDQCLIRWGYRLAPAPDQAEVVAQGVLSACDLALERAVAEARDVALARARDLHAEHKKAGTAGSASAYATLAAQWAEDAEKRVREAAYREALFRITQGRAGHCSAD